MESKGMQKNALIELACLLKLLKCSSLYKLVERITPKSNAESVVGRIWPQTECSKLILFAP